jgi:DNA-binding transcriptional MerR regulator
VSARSYLSIGDVLTLLRQEFPDVTISKIRFLESQGLVNPERTPSGYRKFYEHDVERLRWVLRQQREHFLPLKVIKDRLDEDADGARAGAGAGATKVATRVVTPAAAAGDPAVVEPEPPDPAVVAPVPEPAAAEPVLVGQRASGSRRTAGAGSSADASSGLPGIESGSATASAASPAAAGAGRTPRAASAAASRTAAPASGNGSAGRTGAAPAAAPADGPSTGPSRGSVAPTPPAAAPVAVTATPTAAATPTSPVGPTPGSPSDPAVGASPQTPVAMGGMGGMGGASLSLDELCAASGLRAEYVGQLQEYGLVRAAVVGGAEYFDEEALTVANVAAKFAAYGIEARHLRLYKNAADREAGFIEQVVIPMVRQRNPEARARASQTADDLAGLGQQLKGSLLRTALRDLLQG